MVRIMDRAMQQQFLMLSNDMGNMLDRLERLEQPVHRKRKPPEREQMAQSSHTQMTRTQTSHMQFTHARTRLTPPVHIPTTQAPALDQSCRESGGEQPNNLYIRCLVQGKVCLLNIDCGCSANIASDYMVEKLGLTTLKHPRLMNSSLIIVGNLK